MGQTDDQWPPARWRWPPAHEHLAHVLDELWRSARLRTSRRRLPPDLAAEVYHDAYIDLMSPGKNAARVTGACGTFEGFVATCSALADNAARRHLRQRQREAPLEHDPAAIPAGTRELTSESLLAELHDKHLRAVLRAKYLEGRRTDELTAQFGLTEWGLYQLVLRGLRQLRERLSDWDEGGAT